MHGKLRLQLPLWIMLLLGSVAPAREMGLDPSRLPREGRSLDDFTRYGWVAATLDNGDLNDDGIPDIAAILTQPPSKPDNGAESQRILLVLISSANGTFLPGVSDGGLLVCVHCGGVKESAGVNIKKGILVVSQLTGSREFTDQTWRFRYEATTRRFALIGQDVRTGDSALGTGKKESYNFLTGVKISERYRYDRKRDREITRSSKKEKIPKRVRFLGDTGNE